MRSTLKCGVSKATPTTRNGLPSLRKSIRQPLASGSSGIPPEITAPAYAQARRELDLLRREIKQVFATVDLLVTPTMPSPPVAIAQAADPTAVSIRNTVAL